MLDYRQITTAQRKLVASLRQGKNRRKEGLFVMEGSRSVIDSAPAFDVEMVIATPAWAEAHADELPRSLPTLVTARNDEMERMSALSTPQGVMAVCRIPAHSDNVSLPLGDELLLALDTIQDPGNLGTIVRLADWYGVRRILASRGTADIFSAKAIQSTMGAVARVEVIYCDLPDTLRLMSEAGVPLYGTFLDGDNIYSTALTRGGIVVMGNEGNGISPEVARLIGRRLYLPPYPSEEALGMESLNVAMATAITVAEFRRRAMMP